MRTPGYGITPDRFVRVAHLLPRQCGNVAVDNHTFVNALLWMCRTGAPWRDLPECYGKWVTVYQRFDRWSGNGATGCLSTALQEERIIGVEIRVPAMDSTGGKVHQHAAGAPKKGAPGPSACFASMFVRQVRQCFSAVWADGFPRCRHRFPVM